MSFDFKQRNLYMFSIQMLVYHQLIFDIAVRQYISSELVIGDQRVRHIFADSGFSKMKFIFWNQKLMPDNLIELKYYAASNDLAL